MRSLSRVVKRGLVLGEPLPDPYKSLGDAGIKFRRSSLQMVAGAPGSCKTMFALNVVDRLRVPTLYFSNDSDEMTVVSRMISRTVNRSSSAIADNLNTHKDWAAAQLDGMDWVRWDFTSAPTIPHIEQELEAFNELYGDYPELVVVDVLMKVNYVEDDQFTTLARIMSYLDHLARQTGSSVLVLAHTKESVPGTPCQPRTAVQFQVNQLPSLILTVASYGESFYVAPVKSRNGPQDSTGNTYYAFSLDAEHCRIEEFS